MGGNSSTSVSSYDSFDFVLGVFQHISLPSRVLIFYFAFFFSFLFAKEISTCPVKGVGGYLFLVPFPTMADLRGVLNVEEMD